MKGALAPQAEWACVQVKLKPDGIIGGELVRVFCQESQWDPGVHQEECGQQDEGGSPSPLHCPSEASSRVLCPVLGSPVQER